MFICLDLEPFLLELSKDSWGMGTCHRLIGGLNWHSVQGRLSRDVVTSPDTYSAVVTTATCPYQVLFVPASCERTKRIAIAVVT